MLDERPFDSRNALLKLLEDEGYRRVMGVDSIMRDLLPQPPQPRALSSSSIGACRRWSATSAARCASSGQTRRIAGDRRPVFSYTLPQNVHIAVASKRQVPEGRTYPGFFAPVAESVRQVDECFGEFLRLSAAVEPV